MTLGEWEAGSLLAGNDILNVSVPVPAFSLSPQYDPRIRAIVTQADGTVAPVHYVDEQVAFALTIPLGSIPVAPDIGIDRDKLKRATAKNALTVVQDCVRQALAFLTDQNLITITSVVVHTAALGKLAFQVNYQNLALASSQGRIATVTGG